MKQKNTKTKWWNHKQIHFQNTVKIRLKKDMKYAQKILMPAYYVVCCKHERVAVGLWSWSLFLVLTLCMAEFVWKSFWLFTTKFINVNMYSHGRGDVVNRFLHKFLDLTPVIILKVLLCKVNIMLLLGKLPQKMFPYFIMEWK
jgi:hypothetical protein